MSSEDIAEEIRASFPGTEEVIVQYLAGYLIDDAGEEEDVLQVARDILASVAGNKIEVLEKLMTKLADLLEDQLQARMNNRKGPKKLDKVLDMNKTQMSSTIGLGQGVDLESINKGKCVHRSLLCYNLLRVRRASRVDVKKLEKQEAKLRVRSPS